MELTKKDVKMTKGLAIIFMVLLHLFCMKDNLPFSPLIYIGNTPFAYYIALFGDCCVVIYCFCSGYAHRIMYEKTDMPYKNIVKRLPIFIVQFWLICLLAVVTGLVTDNGNIPHSLSAFIGNFLFFKNSYNGAWWFISTYILLCLLSPVIMKMINKSSVFSLLVFFGIYVLAFSVRFWGVSFLPKTIIFNNLTGVLAPFGTSLLPYVVGAVFYKLKLFSFLESKFRKIKPFYTNIILILFMLCMFVAHCVVQTVFVAIFTGIGTIVCFNLWRKGKKFSSLFSFLGTHSTNIWLTHMFFFDVLFEDFIYFAKYSPLIFLIMMFLTIMLSMVINFIMRQIKTKTVLKKIA